MRVLMLGNSLTTRSRLPERVGELLGAEVTVHARGGARLAEHLNPKAKLGAQTEAALSEGGWDYVVLQEMSQGPATTPGRYQAAVGALCEQVRAAGAMPVLYATPAYGPGCPKLEKLGLTQAEMHEAMHRSFQEAAEKNGALLADVGTAFQVANDPALWAPDGVHPSEKGSQLAAEVLAKTMCS